MIGLRCFVLASLSEPQCDFFDAMQNRQEIVAIGENVFGV